MLKRRTVEKAEAAPATKQVRAPLLRWYAKNKRDLPWRRNPDLYNTLLSEFMLQQTRVDQALPYFHRFHEAFPTLRDLAEAPPERVLKLWEGLGYYSRARNLQKAAQRLAAIRGAPKLDDLAECPGIGPYTLAAIGSIVLNAPLPVVDGNVNRVMARLLALEKPPQTPVVRARILELLGEWICRTAPGDFNQAVMELGATVCTPKNPSCDSCPLRASCRAFELGRAEDFPKRAPKKARPHKDVAAALVTRADGRVLIAQRPERGLLASLWEFPGGTRAGRESIGACCERTIRERLGLRVDVGKRVASVEHGFSHFTITLHAFACRARGGTAKPAPATGKEGAYQDCRWVAAGELPGFAFPRAHWPLVKIAADGSNGGTSRASR
ncbi:MAG: A/G-specific adenine glycosylase [Planctomycetes bacterium]|nr:A/G-specific adenine glycosylase [Planctomycetota bacterium]